MAGSCSLGWICIGTAAGSTYTYNIACIAAGTQQSINFAILVDSTIISFSTQIENSVNVIEDGTGAPDLNPLNNLASDIDNLTDSYPQMSVTKTASPTNYRQCSIVVYNISYPNSGSRSAQNVIIT